MITKASASGLEMPLIGFGTWRIGGTMERDPANDDAGDIQAIQYAMKSGISHIDTAELYANGYCETLVGQAIKPAPRHSYTLATKAKTSHFKYSDLLSACRASLKRLDVDFIDLYYLHAPSQDVPLEETAKALVQLRADGLIKHYGVCNFKKETQARLQDLLDAPIAVNQSHYSLVFREPEITGLIDHCRSTGTIFTAWRPLLWRYPTLQNQPNASAWQKGEYDIVDRISSMLNQTNAQTAISWLISQPNVTTLFKSSNPKHIDEILAANSSMPTSYIEEIRKDFPDQRAVSDAVPLG